MKIADFGVEKWMNEYENDAIYNIAETCVESITIEQLLEIANMKEKAINDIIEMKMTYGAIEGSEEFRNELLKLHNNSNLTIENTTLTHGATGANALVYETLIDPNDHVIVFVPTYQQHYSIPEALHADVQLIELDFEDDYIPNLEKLKAAIKPNTKVICLNNPNNPTGALIDDGTLNEIVKIARENDIYIVCDEVYRGLHHDRGYTPSIVDLYDKGISTGSLSKVYSLAGLRLGWIVGPKEFIDKVNTHRDYNTISCGKIDDYLGTIALKNKDKILERNIKLVNDNVAVLDEWVRKSKYIDYVKPVAGTTAFLKYNIDIPSATLCHNLMRDTGVMLVPGSVMQNEGYLRIGYANSTEILIKGLEIFEEYLDNITK
ncbi:aspartate/methionine/tyrosine aminotransferase [Bacilli bacterium PM5-9]|nr:aspartate/methionine/tyrosine aminotransferase [Bacilli bacterium PM5-9]